MLLSGIFYFILAYVIDKKKNNAYKPADDKQPSQVPFRLQPDGDVISEEQIVKRGPGSMYQIRMEDVHKTYSNGFSAVGGVTLGVQRNEVLGLLGPNGAGKSTCFNMLTMDFPRSQGQIELLNSRIEDFNLQSQGPRVSN